MADNALGGFVRARRESITPAQAGLPTGSRRRTPGLRRGELAELAGISVEYLTRLERGRDRHPSGQVLGALADALQLSADERVHLYRLVKAGTSGTCAQASAPPEPLRPTLRALLDRLEPSPALIVNAAGDVLAYTVGYRQLVAPVGLLDDNNPNIVRYAFTNPRARTVFRDWDRIADDRAASIRSAADLGNYAAAFLAEELSITVGAEFTRRFASSGALPSPTGTERWSHPTAGNLTLAFESLHPASPEDRRLIAYLPADTTTAEALTTLTAQVTLSRA
ncbi:transcriptional regulator with XRE-family HTH domain [Kibdelosporangium banguiense]|uniref:Transcriptional regulator with XRE-family HTH domain n=1 Tax=Kibdelosporangium banguiense TaxID=1365924 RepID=A0ABS4TQM1_9PSEU|nr:helix-turn-helix transcriptional regulator [Kibdelosporangium banguiense]MBP2326240.1 transcriptional regulator with XRE-family HTH domain [Kibdelosporangium banguiense]